jgi:hypothetical protein
MSRWLTGLTCAPPRFAPIGYLVLDRDADKFGAAFPIHQNRIHAVECARWKPRRHLFVVDLQSCHRSHIKVGALALVLKRIQGMPEQRQRIIAIF